MSLMVRVAYDPGPGFQQRLHHTDMEIITDDPSDATARRVAHSNVSNILGIAVWERGNPDIDDGHWRIIEGSV